MRLTLAALGALALSACNPAADTKAAEDGVTAFHQAMDAGQFAAIYRGSSTDMKSSDSEEGLIKLFGALHSKLGNYKSGKTVSWNDNSNTSGHYVTLVREAQFERGPAKEEFVFRIEGKRAVLAGYHVSSNALITG
jgi:hypothetical protein